MKISEKVQVVHVDDMRVRGKRAADLLGIKADRRSLQQDPTRTTEQAHTGVHHERRHDHCGGQRRRPSIACSFARNDRDDENLRVAGGAR